MDTGVSVLCIGAGDIQLSFNPDNPDEVKDTKAIIEDMMKKGYGIMVKVGEDADGDTLYKRAVGFDAERNEYLVIGVPGDKKKKGKERIKADETTAIAKPPSAKGCAPGKIRVPA
jgi:hypothetical protein